MNSPVTLKQLHHGQWLRLLAYLFVVLVGFWAFVRVEQVQKEDCERNNVVLREKMPAAFAAYTELLGEEFNAAPERVERAKRDYAVRLDRLFPPTDCDGLWP